MFEISFKKRNPSQIDSNMKKVHVENWSTREKLALASSVLRSGDQNWMSVSRVIRTLGEPNRPPDWFSQKQCAVQYDMLLNNVGTPKRKKRNEKAIENNIDTPGESIVRKLTQERMEELKMLMSEYKALYLKEKHELEEINKGKLDDRLNDIMVKLDHAEKHEDDEHATFLKQWQDKKQKEAERLSLHLTTDHAHPHTPVEVKPTSPLLTSLLQSPSPAILHRGTGPTISSLLHSAPPVPPVSPVRSAVNTSTPTTLSKLLETPAIIHLPPTPSDVDNANKTIPPAIRSPTAAIRPPTPNLQTRGDQSPRGRVEHVQTSPQQQYSPIRRQSSPMRQQLSPIQQQQSPMKEHQPLLKEETKEEKKDEEEEIIEQIVQDVQKTEAQIEADNILNTIKLEVDDLTPVILDDAMEVVSNMESEAEPVEVVVETAQQQSNDNKIKNEIQDDVSIEGSDNIQNQTGESDVLEDQLDHLAELDSHAVEMIVVGPNQSAVISVHHDGSNENLEDEASVATSPSNEEAVTIVTPSDEDIIKGDTIEITSSELELVPEGKIDLVPDEALVLNSNNDNADVSESSTNKINVEAVIKDLGDVSASEMKEIIEGAEVIVEEEGTEEVIRNPEPEDNIVTSGNNDINKSSDAVEVTTTSMNESGPSIETVVDGVVEVGSTVVDDNVVQCSASDSTVLELGDAETSITASNDATIAHTTTNDVEERMQLSKKYEDEDDEDRIPEPDSSSCSIDEIDNQGMVDATSDKTSSNSEVIKTDEEDKSNKDKNKTDSLMETNQVSTLSSSSSSPTSTAPTALGPSVAGIPPATIDVVTSSSRPDTPSTEEDNEPVANLVKKLPRKTSDSVPNSPISNTMEDGASLRAWKKSIMLVYNRLATHKFASLFLKPITDEQAHGYHSVIHRPMDLSTIKKNIESGVLRTTVEFQRDMLLMFQNAIMYNNSTTLVYERASEMQKECIQHMQLMVEAMGEGVPLRRELLVVDKLTTRQRGSTKLEVIEIPLKRKRTQVIPTSNESPANKRRKSGVPVAVSSASQST